LGEMNEEERALCTLVNRLEVEHAEKLLQFSRLKYQNFLLPGEERTGQMDLDVTRLRTILAKGTLVLIVNDRVGWDTAGGAIAFRRGFKIVAEKDGEPLALSLKIVHGS